MDPAVSSSDQGLVCQTCGDKGFTNAFVYCVKCLDFAIHRYCLDIIPDTVDELVIWYCEDCQVKSTPTQKKKAANLGDITARDLKTQRGIDFLATGTKEFNCQGYLPEHAKNIPRKKRTKRKKVAASLAAKKNGNTVQQRKIRFLEDCNLLNWLLREWKFLDEPQPSSQSYERIKLVSDSFCERNESDKADNHEYQAETNSDISQSVEFENNKQENYYIYAQPIIDPVWSGSFNIIGTRYDQFEGLVAHISNKACYDVFKEANTLASSLHLEMQPKSVLWPKSFQECEPSGDDIALYFLPGNPIDVEAFDNMVLDMMDNGLAMRAATNNAELLIFSSILLPPLFRRVQEKYYLWGVFRGKQDDPTSVASPDRSKDSPNEDIDAKQTATMKRMLTAHSPQSHLSNNGIDDVVEPFVEYSDKETGQPVLCDRSEHNHECDVVHTDGMEYIHRYCSTVTPTTSRSPQDVLEPPPIAEWIHPRLSQHHPLVRRKLYMQKLNPVGPLLILEKSIKSAVFVGPEIFECFTRIGWGGVLNLDDDEVYPEAVTEWMSTLERTGSTVENMKLTGQVNGKKATLDMKFIRETYGVDTGITGHPEAQYEYLTEETLSGKREQNVKQWIKMTSAIFTTLDKGTVSENLTPLAKVLWRIGTRNIHPQVGGEHEVFHHELPIVYSLATGNRAVSYAHLVLMNIWRAYELKEVTFIPHACLISRFLKLKNAVGSNMPPILTVQENCPFVAGLNLDYMVFKSHLKAQTNQLSVMC